MRWTCWSFSWVNCVCVCVCVHCSRCVCVCVCVHCSRCVCVCVFTTVCVRTWMGQIQRTHFTAVILCIIVYVTNKKRKKEISVIVFFFKNWYPIMVRCLNIGENIGKPIYRSISNHLFLIAVIFCRRRLPTIMLKLRMAQNLKTATTFIEQGRILHQKLYTHLCFLMYILHA